MTRTRTWIAGMILGPVTAVFFGLGAVTVLSVPALREQAAILLPAVVALSFAAAVPASLAIAPRMRSRRREERQQGRQAV